MFGVYDLAGFRFHLIGFRAAGFGQLWLTLEGWGFPGVGCLIAVFSGVRLWRLGF